MADYAPNFTPRIRWAYTVQGKNHISTFRCRRNNDIAEATSVANNIITALQPFITARFYLDLTTRSWEFCNQDESVFLPLVVTDAFEGGVSITGRPINQVAMQLTLPYRTLQGGHGFLSLFGTNYNVYGTPEQDFRVTGPEDEDLLNLIIAMQAVDLVGGDNESIVLKPYGNIGFNARWKRKVRNG